MIINYESPRADKKVLRNKKVNEIVVTVMRGELTLSFDGDEESQKRLDRFARRMRANNTETIPWILADNTVVEVTADELERALDEALIKQGEMWIL